LQTQKTILIFTDWYIPGSKAGGPIQSVYNLAGILSKNFIVKVVCRDRDLNSISSFENIKPNEWNEISNQHFVLYLSPDNTGVKIIKSLIKENRYNIIYINGLYSFYFSFLPAFISTIYTVKSVFISVRGMLHQSALSVKRTRKMIYLAFAKGYGLYRNATLMSSNSQETIEIQRILGAQKVGEVPNIPINPNNLTRQEKKFKGANNVLRILFLGRISPEKNPITLVKALQNVQFRVDVTFCGSGNDGIYRSSFETELKLLPNCVNVITINELPHSELSQLFFDHDVLVLPSLGENFGHAIFESLAFGLPVVIGNNTPWKNLESKNAGIEIEPLNEIELLKYISFFNDMSHYVYSEWSDNAIGVATSYYDENNFEDIYLKLFNA